MTDRETAKSFTDSEDTSDEKWPYRPFIRALENAELWTDLKESFYRASENIVDRLSQEYGLFNVEGVAAVFLCRHYLELALKLIITRGRQIVRPGKNASPHEVEKVAKIHDLEKLWRMVLTDARPKIEEQIWRSYDIDFVKHFVDEFNVYDKKGLAFRYAKEGGEQLDYDFRALTRAMQHVYQILENITVNLISTHIENTPQE